MKSFRSIQSGVHEGMASTIKKVATAWATLSLLAIGSAAFATPPNTAPVVNGFTATGNEDIAINLVSQAPGNVFTDIDGDTITHMLIRTLPAHGRLVVNGPIVLNAGDTITVAQLYGLTFVPDADWNGSDSFDFNCSDGLQFAANDATISLNFANMNDAPTGISLTNVNVDENLPMSSSVGFLSATDIDVADSHTFSLVAGTGDDDNASFSIVGNKLQTNESFNYEQKSQYSVRIAATDDSSATYEMAVNIFVNNVNDAPTAGIVNSNITTGDTKTFSYSEFILQFGDEDNDPMDRIQINSLPIIGSLELNGTPVNIGDEILSADLGNLAYVSVSNFAGRVSFDWNGSDGSVYADYDGKVNIRVDMDRNVGSSVRGPIVTGASSVRPNTSFGAGVSIGQVPTGTSPTRPGSGGGMNTNNNRMVGDEITVGIAGIEAPIDFMVHNSYPNPFNETTTIRYELPETYHVLITVFDKVGKEVDVLTNGVQTTGVQTIQWNPSNKLPNGQYFYSIEIKSIDGSPVSHKSGTMMKIK